MDRKNFPPRFPQTHAKLARSIRRLRATARFGTRGRSAESGFAQAATISGRVTNADGQPIVGANVLISTMNAGTTSGANGAYQFTVPESEANGQRVTLTARFIGYTPISRQITLSTGNQSQNFELKTDPFRLDEVVVTGVGDATSTRKLAFSVSRVSEEQMKQVPASSPIAAIAGKVSGARIAVGRVAPAPLRRSACAVRRTSRSATTTR